MNISLPTELERLVAEEVRSGRFASAEEVVAEALRLLLEKNMLIGEINRRIDLGLEDAAQGRTLGPEEARARLRALRAGRSGR